jgi:hypothetical protein
VQDTAPTGELLYLNERGEVTKQTANAETGQQYEPVMVYREDGGIAAKGAQVVRDTLPSPWAEIAASVLGVAAAGVSAWAIRENQKRRDAYKYAEDMEGAAVELIGRIEKNPKVKSAVAKGIGGQYSAGLEQLVQAVTRG